ncbi:hypothetical protein PV08_10394 [Exophiala spinifera]|uniref:Uncharacterized protein n=1 Tax=Exophiala spinifera TaxID=91928 RepID=A0A0D2AXE5_9EURO|nr:uncharacterized protein PV08_10394 [Exophiala spinifera]KIW11095.1 hypothetical protein PV08_10394 [Exophiala spinifera]
MDVPIIDRLRPRKGRSTQSQNDDVADQTLSMAGGTPPTKTPRRAAGKLTTTPKTTAKVTKKVQAKGISKATTTPSKVLRKSVVEKKRKCPAKKNSTKDRTLKPDPAEQSDDEAESTVQQKSTPAKPSPEASLKRVGRLSKTPVKDGAYQPDEDESNEEASAKPTRKPRSTKKPIRKAAPIPFVPIPEHEDSAKTHPPPEEGPNRNSTRVKVTLKVKKPASPGLATPHPGRHSTSSDLRSSPDTFHTASPAARSDGPNLSTESPRPSASFWTSAKSPKRRSPDNQDDDGNGYPRSPKRARSVNATTASSSLPKRGTSTQPRQGGGDYLTIADADRLLEEITVMPRKLELAEIAALFVCLQEKCIRFSQLHFNYNLTEDQQAVWPLHQLDEEKYRSFFNMARFLVDANHCGWREFFTSRKHRVPFVHGVLGERFKHNIFKIPGFGLGRDEVNKLAEIDRMYIRYDAVVRSKVRAEYLEALKFDKAEDWATSVDVDENAGNKGDNAAVKPPTPAPGTSAHRSVPSGSSSEASDPKVNHFTTKYAASLDNDATQLASQIMEQLELVLPPPVFDPLRPHDPQTFSEKARQASFRRLIESDLITLLKYMGGLSLSIRLTGINGTIIRLAEAYPKGSEYHLADSVDNICVNSTYCNLTCPDTPATLRIYMTCWCRLEGVVPHGKNRLELERFQTEHQDPDGLEEFTWEQYEEEVFPPLPYELQTTPEGRAAVADLPIVAGTEWDVSMAQASWSDNERRHDHVFEGDDDDDDHDDRRNNPSKRRAPGPERGCFVTYYNKIAPTNVYCAWTPKASRPTKFPDVGDNDDVNVNDDGAKVDVTLESAIFHAKLDRQDRQGDGRAGAENSSHIGSTIDLIREYHVGEWLVASSVAGGILAYVVSAANRESLAPNLVFFSNGNENNKMVSSAASAAVVRRLLRTVPSSVVRSVSDALGLTVAAAREYIVTVLAWAQHLEQRTVQGVRDVAADLSRSVALMSASRSLAASNAKSGVSTPTFVEVTTLSTPEYL